LDVDHIIHGLRDRHPEVTYRQMACVNDRPEFLEMVAEWANPQIAALLAEKAIAIDFNSAKSHSHHHHNDRSHHHHH